ncbi:MAG: membrane protein insertase YidC [Ignavibacteria bacterium]|nr:membrane protein insertase YidC [Ignavibacteria bacterium]
MNTTYIITYDYFEKLMEQMDKRSFIGFILIGIIITAWIVYSSTNTRTVEPAQTKAVIEQKEAPKSEMSTPKTDNDLNKFGTTYGKFTGKKEQFITIETDLYRAKISTKGGTIARWELKKYNSWYGEPAQLITPHSREFSLHFFSEDGKSIDSRKLDFTISPAGDYFKIRANQTLTLTARLQVANGSFIEKKMTFHGDKYSMDAGVTFSNMENYLSQKRFDVSWNGGVQFQEQNSVDEANTAVAIASMNGTTHELDATEYVNPLKFDQSGIVEFVSTRTKYFSAAMIQKSPNPEATVSLSGVRIGAEHGGMTEKYSMSYRLPYRGADQTTDFTVYIGPQDYDILKTYGLGSTINFGWRWIIAPIGEYFMLPIFSFIHHFIANYGIAILIFSALMKLLLYPLSISQVRSTQKMQLLAPEIAKIREKYKDDQVSQQQETMKLYSEYGINPAGGCLPMILQMPILYALWSVLSNSIQLRQANFFGWIHDLSVPDVIFDLGFKIPLFEIDKFSGLALLMGATLFIQQKMSVTDPRQKAMVYMMPVMFTLMFSSFPAGLNLYYFTFNLLGIIQQIYVSKFSKNKLTLADLRGVPRKEGWLQKKMREAQELSASQGRSMPGQPTQSKNNKQSKPQKPINRKK